MPTLIVLIGPTGTGKTELSLQLAAHFKTSIISADSRQIYANIPIGTAAPDSDQLARAPHFFVGTLALTDYYSAARYESEALDVLEKIFRTRPVAIMTGGSMLYIDAVCRGIDDIPTIDENTRRTLLDRFHSEGLTVLCDELQRLDPEYFSIVDQKNPKRVIHALEVCHVTGRTYTSFRTQTPKTRPFRILKIGLQRPREELYARINARVDAMITAGLLDEARAVLPLRNLNSLNTVGFKELFRYFDGEWTLPFAIEKIKQHTRIYSRKQTTWFRRDPDIRWFHPDDNSNILHYLETSL